MWREVVGLIIPASAGVIAANIIGELWRKSNVGTGCNTISGMIGGVVGGLIAGAFGSDADPTGGGLVAEILSGSIGGGVLMMTIGFIK